MKDIIKDRLNERAKELNCLYQVIDLLRHENSSLNYVFQQLVKIIPPAWQYPSVCCVRITYEDEVFKSEEFLETLWVQSADIVVDDKVMGKIEVFYMQFIRLINGSQFLPEEQKLLNVIALKISEYLFSRKLQKTIELLQKESHLLTHEMESNEILPVFHDQHWKWRYRMVEKLVGKLDREKTGVVACYVIGSTKNATAGPKSDIDLLIHFRGNDLQRNALLAYISGWSHALAEYNYEKTGCLSEDGLIDLHIITDEDIEKKTSYAIMIGSTENSARKIPFAGE